MEFWNQLWEHRERRWPERALCSDCARGGGAHVVPTVGLRCWGLPPGRRDSLEPGRSRTEWPGFRDGRYSHCTVAAVMVGTVGGRGPEVTREWQG